MANTSVLIEDLQNALDSVNTITDYQEPMLAAIDTVDDLSSTSKSHDNCLDSGISAVVDEKENITKAFASVATIADTMSTAISCFTKAEDGSYTVDQEKWKNFISTSPLLSEEERENMKSETFNFYYTKDSFTEHMTDDERRILEETKATIIEEMMESSVSDYYPSLEYRNRASWYNALVEKYIGRGYSEEEAQRLARLEMAEAEMAETGGTVVSGLTASTVTDLRSGLEPANMDDLVNKYLNEGYTQEQAQELASLEQKYYDAVDLVETTSDNWAIGADTDALNALNAKKAEFTATNTVSQPANPPSGGSGGSYTSTTSTSARASSITSATGATTVAAATPIASTLSVETPTVTTNNEPVIEEIVTPQENVSQSNTATITPTNPTPEVSVQTPTTNTTPPTIETPAPTTPEGVAGNISNIVTNHAPTSTGTSTATAAGSIASIANASNNGVAPLPDLPDANPNTELGPNGTLENTITNNNSSGMKPVDVVTLDKETSTPTTIETKSSAAPIALGVGAAGMAAAAGIGGPKVVSAYKHKHNSFAFMNEQTEEVEDEFQESEPLEEESEEDLKFDPRRWIDEQSSTDNNGELE